MNRIAAKGGPWDSLDFMVGAQSKESPLQVNDPQVAPRIFDNGINVSAGQSALPGEAVILQVADSLRRADPDTPEVILENGTNVAIRQSTTNDLAHRRLRTRWSFMEGRYLPSIPPVQARLGAQPDGSVLRRENCSGIGTR